MATPYVAYLASPDQREFDVPFPYISRSHVIVQVNGGEAPISRWLSDSRLRLQSGVSGGDFVEIYRDTPTEEALVQFQDGNVLTAEDLNVAVRQTLFKQQELDSAYERNIISAQARLAAAGGIVIPVDGLFDSIVAELAENATVFNFQNRLNDIDVNALNILAQATSVSGLQATVAGETQARIDGDAAVASQLSLIQATADDNAAAILAEQTARADADSALAISISGLNTRVDDAEATVVSEQLARASADTALAQEITALETAVDGNTASVSTVSQSINGLEARYGVVLDVNGYITGFAQNNDGVTGSFQVVADRFQIVDPGNGTPFAPFEVSNGVTFIKDAVIGNLSVSKLVNGTLSADINVGTGRIIWDNGSFMKVTGLGFGTNNQFIDWFGPSRAINLCDEASAIQYLKTNGDAYFGGSLTAGTLRNAARSTQVSATASVSTGTFGSNGGSRTVVVSFFSERSVDISGACNGSGTPSVTIRLRRNGTILTTRSFSGSIACDAGNGQFEPGRWIETLSGSFTLTDNTGGSSAEYTAELVSRPLSTPPSSQLGGIAHEQSLGVVSTEE